MFRGNWARHWRGWRRGQTRAGGCVPGALLDASLGGANCISKPPTKRNCIVDSTVTLDTHAIPTRACGDKLFSSPHAIPHACVVDRQRKLISMFAQSNMNRHARRPRKFNTGSSPKFSVPLQKGCQRVLLFHHPSQSVPTQQQQKTKDRINIHNSKSQLPLRFTCFVLSTHVSHLVTNAVAPPPNSS